MWHLSCWWCTWCIHSNILSGKLLGYQTIMCFGNGYPILFIFALIASTPPHTIFNSTNRSQGEPNVTILNTYIRKRKSCTTLLPLLLIRCETQSLVLHSMMQRSSLWISGSFCIVLNVYVQKKLDACSFIDNSETPPALECYLANPGVWPSYRDQ